MRILGQDDFAIRQAGEGQPGSFTSKPWWSQAIVLAAGVTMNMVLALFVLTIAFATGTTASTGDVRVREVAPDSPASRAGFQIGDIVRAIDGRKIERSNDLVNYVRAQARLNPDKEVTLEVERNGRPLPPIKAVPRAEPPEGQGPLGIGLEEVQGPDCRRAARGIRSGGVAIGSGDRADRGAAGAAARAAHRPSDAPTVGGPIEIFRVTGQVAQFGLPTFLKLVGVLSVNLAVLNILPFPGLDGGRLFFVLLAGSSASASRRRSRPPCTPSASCCCSCCSSWSASRTSAASLAAKRAGGDPRARVGRVPQRSGPRRDRRPRTVAACVAARSSAPTSFAVSATAVAPRSSRTACAR